ncbi:hypothetical protein Poli38472_013465 [Pythium oligandrum]|uniref:Uncharacterized protein n=1 Tax=Pythium oligandrum TaxID=41045 RepID=A0A8K1FD69_PYTOL|nr:hypothetical protein Poli38472_014857 [Pythium oligandrum]TMW57678.1 hypothetical protein Poli38472_014865 [Pythium oligandrum]TMW57991.1 hypothetical protein Poli38472_013465 [Pythium oligandrum]|eukprot:TMW57670.1 hypothetical protein Poli38472_014857 [Pythium oligandrum]
MEREEIAIRVISILYALGIFLLILSLQSRDINTIMLVTVYTMVFSCPFLWCIIRFCREYAARRRLVVLPTKKEKKKPDIALPKAKAAVRTQAEILAEQRERVRNLHGVGDKKLKVKPPKRKGPPHLDKKA